MLRTKTATAQDVQVKEIHMETCLIAPAKILRAVTETADRFYDASLTTKAAWHIAQHKKGGFAHGMRTVWSYFRPTKNPVVVLYRDIHGAFFCAEGAPQVKQAMRQGVAVIRALIIPGTAEDAIAHALRKAVDFAVEVKATAVAVDSCAAKRTWGITPIKAWAAKHALKVSAWASRGNRFIAELIGVSRELLRGMREYEEQEQGTFDNPYLTAFETAKSMPKTDGSVTLLMQMFGLSRGVCGALVYHPAKLGLA